MAPGTVCVWPYEAMYDEEVSQRGNIDNDVRHRLSEEFFKPISDERSGSNSLIFYYSNFSNPASTEEAPRYVLVGVSRIRQVGNALFYRGVSERIQKQYAGGLIWGTTRHLALSSGRPKAAVPRLSR